MCLRPVWSGLSALSAVKLLRDTTVLIDLLWFNVMQYTPACFITFLIYYSPYSSSKILLYLFVNFFVNIVIKTHGSESRGQELQRKPLN